VSLVAILDADKEGFLRSERSLIQTCGRAARNIHGTVVFFADEMTGSIRRAVDECERRRKLQVVYNERHNITPTTITKNIDNVLGSAYEADYATMPAVGESEAPYRTPGELDRAIRELTDRMHTAAADLEFEKAARLRDRIRELEARELEVRAPE